MNLHTKSLCTILVFFPLKRQCTVFEERPLGHTLSVTVCPSQMLTRTTDYPRFRWQYTLDSESLSLVYSMLASSRDGFYTWGIDSLNLEDVPTVLYFHPWEFNLDVRSNEPPLHSRVISYHGIEKTSETLDWLLSTYNFGSIKEIVDNSSRY